MLFTFQWYCLIVPLLSPAFFFLLVVIVLHVAKFLKGRTKNTQTNVQSKDCSNLRSALIFRQKFLATNIFFIHSKKCTPGTTCMQIWLYHLHQLIFMFMRILVNFIYICVNHNSEYVLKIYDRSKIIGYLFW